MHLCSDLFLVVRISAYANVYFKTTFKCPEVHYRSAVRFGQALPGYLITAHYVYASLR